MFQNRQSYEFIYGKDMYLLIIELDDEVSKWWDKIVL